MAQDLVYYFGQIDEVRRTLGEIQTNFNMSAVIDGTKDSIQVEVHSFSRDPMTPNTIIYHNDPIGWWVVKKDQVKRYANEQGFYYVHSLTMLGAIDLLKNRDLTDCGFNANGYTIDEFFKKLLKLSNFEFDYEIDYGNNVDKDKKVDYIKSYENYTLLSAIRDFFNGYNCDVKLGFQTEQIVSPIRFVKLKKAIFKIIPRTGNIDLTPIDISEFDDIRESINYDKESYGATVISNAQNVVSTEQKTFPQIGGVNVTGEDYATSISRCYIKLPSPAWRVNWVKAISPKMIALYKEGAQTLSDFLNGKQYYYGLTSVKDLIIAMEEYEAQNPSAELQYLIQQLKIKKDNAIDYFDKVSTTFYNNTAYDHKVDFNGDYGTIIKEEKNPYIPFLDIIGEFTTTSYDAHQVALMDKNSSNLLKNGRLALVWERGSDKISNFVSLFDQGEGYRVINKYWDKCDATKYQNMLYSGATYKAFNFATYNGSKWYLVALRNVDGIFVPTQFSRAETIFQVNYIPMSDIKVKQDNENETKDIQLYNQNGKLNDSVALSKMVDSYSKEIQNETITRYMHYTNVSDIPQIGQIVMDGDNRYVINNISMDFYTNESDNSNSVGYYIECEFTLSLYVSTKSIMTNPNTNIVDYQIPQKYNVKRRQTYRDYYELAFSNDPLANQETPYAKLSDYLPLDYYQVPREFDHTALIKINYESEIGTPASDTWYYQLNSTTYVMNKSIYEIVDFDDNNTLGYDIQNTRSGFNMRDLWAGQFQAVTTPVQYVDDFGKFVGITLKMTGREALEQAYSQIDTDNNPVMFSAHCFIPQEIYDLVAQTPTPTDSNEVYEETYYRVVEASPIYHTSITINADDIGIPLDLELTNENILGLTNVAVVDNGNTLNPANYSLSITQLSGRNITITFLTRTSVLGSNRGTLEFYFYVQYMLYTSTADYIIDEPNYEKDPIEVPVFEYSLQIGDSKDVKVGDSIFENKGIASFYSCVVVDSGVATMLNASKWTPQLTITTQTISDDYYDKSVTISGSNGTLFEIINRQLKMSAYESIALVLYGNSTSNLFVLQNQNHSSTKINSSDLVGKDIIVFKHTINEIKVVDGNANADIDSKVMYLIHAPQDAQFENDDLVLCLNFYKLK